MTTMTHLSPIPEGATFVAAHAKADAQVVVIEGKDALLVDGKIVPLHPSAAKPCSVLDMLNQCSRTDLPKALAHLRSL